MVPPTGPPAIDPSRTVTLNNPRTLVFGAGCAQRCVDDLATRGLSRAFVISGPSTRKLFDSIRDGLISRGLRLTTLLSRLPGRAGRR